MGKLQSAITSILTCESKFYQVKLLILIHSVCHTKIMSSQKLHELIIQESKVVIHDMEPQVDKRGRKKKELEGKKRKVMLGWDLNSQPSAWKAVPLPTIPPWQ